MSDVDVWEPEIGPVLEQVVAATAGQRFDFSDLATLAVLRDPGPEPAPAEGVTWSAATIPNTAGDHDVPVRIYRPAVPDPLQPAYVLYHGGGLAFGHLNTEHQRCVELTRRCGAVGVSVDFRMAPDHAPEVLLDDCYAPLRWVTEHATEFDVDPRRIAVTGSSGGGSMTLSIAQLARDRGDTAPMLQLAFYPNTDDRMPPEHVSRHREYPVIAAENVAQVMRNLVPQEPATPYIIPNRTDDLAGLCRAFVLVGQNDPLRDEGIDYAWRMIRADVPTELHVLPGAPHAFDHLTPDGATTRKAYDLMCDAMARAAAAA